MSAVSEINKLTNNFVKPRFKKPIHFAPKGMGFFSIRESELEQFFKEIGPEYNGSTDGSCIQWMLLALCKNDTDFHKKLCHELLNFLIKNTCQGPKINTKKIWMLVEFLQKA